MLLEAGDKDLNSIENNRTPFCVVRPKVRTHLCGLKQPLSIWSAVDKSQAEYTNYCPFLTGVPVETMETMCKYTTDVISSCAFGIESNSLKNPNAEIRENFRKIFENSFRKGIAGLLMFFAPNLQNFFRLKFVDDEYANFLRRTIWSTVEYRWVLTKHCNIWTITQFFIGSETQFCLLWPSLRISERNS